jgi:hypothetical protein
MRALGTSLDPYEVDEILSGIVSGKAMPTKRIPNDVFRRLINEAVTIVQEAGPTIAAFEAVYQT